MQMNNFQNCRSRPLRSKGFTLVEVLCSIAIAAFVVSALFYGFENGFAIMKTTREDLRATQILMQRTEAIRLLTWQQLSNCPNSFTEYYNPTGSTNNSSGTVYYGTLDATGADTNISDTVVYKGDLHLITIAVAWTNDIGSRPVPHSRQMQTLSAKYGMQNYLATVSAP